MKIISTNQDTITVKIPKSKARGIVKGISLYIDEFRGILKENLGEE